MARFMLNLSIPRSFWWPLTLMMLIKLFGDAFDLVPDFYQNGDDGGKADE